MLKLVKGVIEWGSEKGIHAKLSASSQLVFAIGELCNELPDAIAKGKSDDEIKKELGDVMVFYINYLVIYRDASAVYIAKRVESAATYDGGFDADNDLAEIIIDGLRDSVNGSYSLGFFRMLHAIADRLDATLEECLQLAHDKNAKRKHKMQNGKLVKTEDL